MIDYDVLCGHVALRGFMVDPYRYCSTLGRSTYWPGRQTSFLFFSFPSLRHNDRGVLPFA